MGEMENIRVLHDGYWQNKIFLPFSSYLKNHQLVSSQHRLHLTVMTMVMIRRWYLVRNPKSVMGEMENIRFLHDGSQQRNRSRFGG
jgi:hypothetical protein